MNSHPVAISVVVWAYCCLNALAFYPKENDDFDVVTPQYREADREEGDNNTDLRKSILKKLWFTKFLKEYMQYPDEIVASSGKTVDTDGKIIESNDETETDDKQTRHIAEKREQTEDLMSLVQAYLSQVKERQSKESLSLPSLRFGRSITQ